MSKVLCAGQLAADILVRPVDRLDFASDTRRVEPIRLANGGDCLNAAIGLRRLGLAVSFAGLVGRDQWGDFLASVIEREGIDGRGLKRAPEAGTCTVLVAINSQGERTFFYHGGANDLFSLRDVDPALAAEADAVHVGGTYLLPRFDGEGAAELFREARARGKLTSMDVTWDVAGPLAVRHRPLPAAPVLVPAQRQGGREDHRRRPARGDGRLPARPGSGRRGDQARRARLLRAAGRRAGLRGAGLRRPGRGHHRRGGLLRGRLPGGAAAGLGPGALGPPGLRRGGPEHPAGGRHRGHAHLRGSHANS